MIEQIENAAAFERLRDEWNALLESSSSNCLFLSWEWLHTWWQHLAEDTKLSILAVRWNGELAAIAPLVLRPPRYSRLLPFRSLEFLGTGFVGSDYLDLIVRQGREGQAIEELAEHFSRGSLMLELAQLRSGSCLAAQLAARLAARGWRPSRAQTHVCPYINLSGHSWQSFLAGLGSEHRYNFQRRLKNLGKQFEVRFEQACTEERRQEALAVLLDLHNRRWSERGGGSDAFHTPELVSFHQKFSRLALERGWLRLSVLWLDGKPVASLYGFRFGHVFYFYQSGFDPEFRKQSVGLVTMGLAIKEALEEGAEEYDLLHGNEPYKAHWARETRELERLEIYPPLVQGVLYRRAVGFSRAARKVARNVLPNSVADRIRAPKRG